MQLTTKIFYNKGSNTRVASTLHTLDN